MPDTPAPNGTCFCGCKKTIGYGRFFAPGHDKIAEAAYMAAYHQGSVAQLLVNVGHGPDSKKSIRQAALDRGGWEECPKGCGYAGAPASIRNHLNKHEPADRTTEQ